MNNISLITFRIQYQLNPDNTISTTFRKQLSSKFPILRLPI